MRRMAYIPASLKKRTMAYVVALAKVVLQAATHPGSRRRRSALKNELNRCVTRNVSCSTQRSGASRSARMQTGRRIKLNRPAIKEVHLSNRAPVFLKHVSLAMSRAYHIHPSAACIRARAGVRAYVRLNMQQSINRFYVKKVTTYGRRH
jgi:hypothetical protein